MSMKGNKHRIMRIVTVIILCLATRGNVFAQTLPVMSWYDNESFEMYLQAVREDRYRYAQRLIPIIADTYRKAYAEYEQGNYNTCINIIGNFFDTFTIYEIHAYICTDLLELKGLAYCRAGQPDYGIYNLRRAMDLGSLTAKEELSKYFGEELRNAYKNYFKENYTSCIQDINKALYTGLQNSEIYVLAGDAYRDTHNYSEAKRYYKTARKLGDTFYSTRIKKMKELRKSLK